MKQKSKKKIIILSTVAVLAIGGVCLSIFLQGKNSNDDMVAKEREYNAQIGDITVGIDAAGKISLNEIPYYLPEGITVKEFCVGVGDTVKKGDLLATVDQNAIKKTLKDLESKRGSALSVVNKAVLDKLSYASQSTAKIDDISYQSRKTYDDAVRQQNRTISLIEEQIPSINSQVESLEANINVLKPDLENYTTQLVDLQGQIETLKLQEESLNKELTSAKATLSDLQSDRQSEVEREDTSIERTKSDDNAQLSSLLDVVTAAKLELDAVDKEIADTKMHLDTPGLYADVDGVVLSIAEKVENPTGTNPIITFGNQEKQKLALLVDSTSINDVQVGQKVKFYSDAYPSQALTGVVSGKKLVPNSDGKYEVSVSVDSTDAQLQQGMNVTSTLIVQEKTNILTLSNKSITLKDGKQYVNIRNSDGTLKEVEIKTGFSDGRFSEILSGLKEGDIVIVRAEV